MGRKGADLSTRASGARVEALLTRLPVELIFGAAFVALVTLPLPDGAVFFAPAALVALGILSTQSR